MLSRLAEISQEAEGAIKEDYSFIILSDKAVSKTRIPLSALLACSSIHHHLINKQLRTKIGIILETGEAREVHHHCLLFGYGADAINPYLAFEAIYQSLEDGALQDENLKEKDQIVEAYKKGTKKGILKVMALSLIHI